MQYENIIKCLGCKVSVHFLSKPKEKEKKNIFLLDTSASCWIKKMKTNRRKREWSIKGKMWHLGC